MFDIRSTVFILAMVDNLRRYDSWGGETHVQKALYFLDKKCAVRTGFDFILYKHGPYSFDLHDTLDTLFASCLLEHQIQPPYGPRIRVTETGKDYLAKHSSPLSTEKKAIKTVAGWFEKKGVADLEKMATALWVQQESPSLPDAAKAERVHTIKPHIPVEDARQALQAVAALSL